MYTLLFLLQTEPEELAVLGSLRIMQVQKSTLYAYYWGIHQLMFKDLSIQMKVASD